MGKGTVAERSRGWSCADMLYEWLILTELLIVAGVRVAELRVAELLRVVEIESG
jgi:hypothetical protein